MRLSPLSLPAGAPTWPNRSVRLRPVQVTPATFLSCRGHGLGGGGGGRHPPAGKKCRPEAVVGPQDFLGTEAPRRRLLDCAPRDRAAAPSAVRCRCPSGGHTHNLGLPGAGAQGPKPTVQAASAPAPAACSLRVWEMAPSSPYPLGVSVVDGGVNVAVYSSVAESVSFCAFGPGGSESRHALTLADSDIWHGFVPGVVPGRSTGSGSPALTRLRPACAATRPSYCSTPTVGRWPATWPGGRHGAERRRAGPAPPTRHGLRPDAPRSVVVQSTFDWGGDQPLGQAVTDSVIYELHVKGFTGPAPRGAGGRTGHLRRAGPSPGHRLPEGSRA